MCWCVKITKRYPENRGWLSSNQLGNLVNQERFGIPTYSNSFCFWGPLKSHESDTPVGSFIIFFVSGFYSPTFFFPRGSRTSPQSGYWWTNHTVNQNQQVSSGIMGCKKNWVIRPEIRRLPCHQICALQPKLPDLFEATDVRRPFGEVLQLNSKFYSWLMVSNICYFP